jgi:hypothetical protein
MKRLVLAAFVVTVLIAALFVRCFGARDRAFSLYDMFSGFAYLRHVHVEAEKKIDALPAQRLDTLIRDARRLSATQPSGGLLRGPDIPAEFADLQPNWVAIGPDKVMLEFVGGLDHVGLVARKNESGVWSLRKYLEDYEVVIR